MSRKLIEAKKIKVLSKISENRHILFGAFSDSITKTNRSDKWQEICLFAKELKIVSESKDWTYLRDVFWQNCKRGAFAKLDNTNKRCHPGEDYKLNSCDNMVLDIVGRDAEVITDTKDEDAMNLIYNYSQPCIYENTTTNYSASQLEPELKLEDPGPCKIENMSPSNPASYFEPELEPVSCKTESMSSCNSVPHFESVPNSSKRKRLPNKKKNSTVLKKRKLMVEHLKLVNYKTRLEIALLEKKLNYPPSVFTKSLSDPGTVTHDSSSDPDTANDGDSLPSENQEVCS